MKSCSIEMVRSVERRLPGGETETLAAGQRYILDATEAQRYLEPTKELREINGAVVEVEPAAKLIREFDVEEEAAARAAETRASDEPAEAVEEPATFATDGE